MMHGSELFTGYALDGFGQEPNDDEISSDARRRAHDSSCRGGPTSPGCRPTTISTGEPYPLQHPRGR
jgi:glutamine synthetase